MTEEFWKNTLKDEYLAKFLVMSDQISRGVSIDFYINPDSGVNSASQFMYWFENEFSFVKDPILFQFCRILKVSINKNVICDFETFDFPKIWDYSRNQVIPSSRLIIPILKSRVPDSEFKHVKILRAAMHQKNSKSLNRTF